MKDAISKAQLISIMLDACKVRGTQNKIAEDAGVSRSRVSEVVNGKYDISASIARALGYRPVTVYVPIRKEAT